MANARQVVYYTTITPLSNTPPPSLPRRVLFSGRTYFALVYFAITPSPFRFNAVVVVDAVFIVVGVVGLFTGNYRCSSLEFSEWQQTGTFFFLYRS